MEEKSVKEFYCFHDIKNEVETNVERYLNKNSNNKMTSDEMS